VGGKVVEINGDRVQVNMADLKQAAELGSVESQTRLAEYYQRGKHGLATNRVEAYKWAWVAASAGSNSARHLRQELELFMNTKEAAEGKRLQTRTFRGAKPNHEERD